MPGNQETPEQRKRRERFEEKENQTEKLIKDAIKANRAEPKGMILFPIGIFLFIATIILLLMGATIVALLLFILLIAGVLILYYSDSVIVIKETQCPMFEYWGKRVGCLIPDSYLIQFGGKGWFSLGGLKILFPWESVKMIPGFDYLSMHEKPPEESKQADGKKTQEKKPPRDYYICHTRKFDRKVFGDEDIEFTNSDAKVVMYATLRAFDPGLVSYSGTDVLTVQVPRLIMEAARQIFWDTDVNTLTGDVGTKKNPASGTSAREDIAQKIIDNVDINKLHSYGFEIFNIVIVDVILSEGTKESRRKIQQAEVELQKLSIDEDIEKKKIEIERHKADQEEQKGLGTFKRLKSTVVSSGEPTKEDIQRAMEFEINYKKFQKGVEHVTIIESGGTSGGESDIAKTGAILGSTFFGNLPKQQQQEMLKEMKKAKKGSEKDSEKEDDESQFKNEE